MSTKQNTSKDNNRLGLHFTVKKDDELFFKYSRCSWKNLCKKWKGALTLSTFKEYVNSWDLKDNMIIEFNTDLPMHGKIGFYKKKTIHS